MIATETVDPSNELDRQEQLLPFLLNPTSYPHYAPSVRLIQTHGSFVFLAPPFVYKVKKAVNLGFLDFSSLKKRRHFCEREVILNRRLCPDVYLDVIPISKSGKSLVFGEGDEVVEYAIRMRKLSERNFLDKLLEKEAVTLADVDRIVSTLARFYQAQRPTREIEAWGQIDRLKISTDENFRQTQDFVGQTLSRPASEAIRFYTDEFYKRREGLFRSRVKQRWIRDCHGDLHVEHIHLTPKAVKIYDCIEFNDRLRYVDVASDVAFLAMDLDYRGRPDLSKYFTEKISDALDDRAMVQLMNFYKCYRAYVRGKVESMQSVAHAASNEEKQTSVERAQRYFRLALQYAIGGSEPQILVVMGRIASGKSTLAKALSAELGWPVLSSDRVRKEMAGFSLYERSGEAARSRLYSPETTEKTYRALLGGAIDRGRKGQSVILDATFAKRAQREQLKARLDSKAIRFRIIEAQATDMTVKKRLKDREAKADEISDARLEDFEVLTRLYEPPMELDSQRLITLLAGPILEQSVASLLRQLVNVQFSPPEKRSRERSGRRRESIQSQFRFPRG